MARIDLITGPLGAGKTRFVLNYTSYLKNKGETFCVIENEYGMAGVDTIALENFKIRTYEISGGCICCTLKVKLHEYLIELNNKVDHIIVETSGVFNGKSFLEVYCSAAEKIKNCSEKNLLQIGMWLCIVDTKSLSYYTESDKELLQDELTLAGSVYYSKTDLCTKSEYDNAKKMVYNYFSSNLPAQYFGNLSEEDFEKISESGITPRECTIESKNHSSYYQSITLYIEMMGIDKMKQAIEAASKDRGVLRIKGIVQCNEGSFSVNYAPGCVFVGKTTSEKSCINIIGKNLKREWLKEIFSTKQ